MADGTSNAAPEFLQRIERAREHNRRCAELRILDREFYRAYRKYIRIPVNAVERARNERWSTLTNTLRMARSGRWHVASSVALLRSLRAVAK